MERRKKIVLAFLLSAALFGYGQQTPATNPASQAAESETSASKVDTLPPGLPRIKPIEHKDIVYRQIGGHDLKLDVYEQPGSQPAPVVVYWHGGAWWKGERPATYGSFPRVCSAWAFRSSASTIVLQMWRSRLPQSRMSAVRWPG